MKRCFLLILLVTPLLAEAGGLGENIRRKSWTCTPEAEELLRAWAREGAAYRPRADHVGLFARAQLKYGLNHADYLHRWYERPLYQDTSYRVADERDVLVNPLSWRKTAELVRAAKMDGLAACPTQSGRHWIIPRSVEKGGEMTAFLELPYGYHEGGLDKYLKVAEMAYAMPNAYRIDGKVVLTRYPAVRESELDKAEAFRHALDAKYGKDAFIVLYYVTAFEDGLPDGPMTVAALEKAREHLRRVLRKTDGIFYAGWEVYWPRRYDLAFERDVIVPMLRAVLSEPEFAGRKYLGMPMCQGHANCYRWCYSLDSNGTQMLVDRMRAMEALRPDFILACEWDEQNENTHFRPTVSCGHTNLRILRYWADRFAGHAPEPWPLDGERARGLPNLVLSYRKSLVVGEPVEAEVLNIPDGTFVGETFTVALAWRDAAGMVRRSYDAQTLAADELKAVRFVSRASELAAARAVSPELTVRTSSGRTFRFAEGFWPLDVHATRQVDTWWIKTPVRELGEARGELRGTGPDANGVYEIAGDVSGDAPFDSVEVLEGPDTVFMAGSGDSSPDVERFVLDIQAHTAAEGLYALTGTVTAVGMPNARLSRPRSRCIATEGLAWAFRNVPLRGWPWTLTLDVPRAEVASGAVVLDLPGWFRGRIKLARVIEKDVVGLNGKGGASLTLRRDLRTPSIPARLGTNRVSFAFRMKPLDDNAVLRIQAVDAQKRVWRSRPFQPFRTPAKRSVSYTVFERDEETVSRVSLDASLVPAEVRYAFSPTRGSVVAAEGLGRAYWGILGGYLPQVNGIGRGESNYGNALAYNIGRKTSDWDDSAPTYEREPDGTWSVRFKGAEYATFPQQLLSLYAGWELDVEVWPETLEGAQAIFGCSAVGCNVTLVDGVPQASYFDALGYARQSGSVRTAKGPRLKAKAWNRLKVAYDVQALTVSVDGAAGTPCAFSSYMHQQRYTTVGAENHAMQFFRGKLRNLAVRVR